MAITIQQAAEMAKAKTTDKRWVNAINRAVEGASTWVITELATSTAITTESGQTYFVTENRCQCRAAVWIRMMRANQGTVEVEVPLTGQAQPIAEVASVDELIFREDELR